MLALSLAALAPALARAQAMVSPPRPATRRAPVPKPGDTTPATTPAATSGPASIPQLASRWNYSERTDNGTGTLVEVGLDSAQPGTVTLHIRYKDDGSHSQTGKPRTSDTYATAPAVSWQAFSRTALGKMQAARFSCSSSDYIPGFGAPEAKVRVLQVVDSRISAGPMPGTVSMSCGDSPSLFTLRIAGTTPESAPTVGGEYTGQNVRVIAALTALSRPPVSGLSGSR